MRLLLKKFFYVERPHDRDFLRMVFLLLGMGLIMLASASYPSALYNMGDALYYIKRQVFFAVLGVGFMFLVSAFDYHYLSKIAFVLMALAVVGLVAVLIMGNLVNNARRWITIAGVSFQPSEVAKLAVIVGFSTSISRKKTLMRTTRQGIVPYMAYLLLVVYLMMKEPHLSGSVLILAVGLTLMFVGGIDWKWVVSGLAVCGLVVYLFLSGVIPYGQDRIAMWQNPWIDAQGEGYQLSQSLIAIGSGGLTGLGLGKSRQKFLYLPESQNDFIFSIVCEELGFLGASIILITFMFIIFRGYQIARYAKDRFGSLLVIGVITQLALQTFLNVAVVTGLVPTTGVSLPFFSYGGTALVTQLVEMGIVLSVSRQCKEDDRDEPEKAELKLVEKDKPKK